MEGDTFSPGMLRVISEKSAAKVCDLSYATMRRKLVEGTGPKHVRLSERRVGYRVRDVEAWLAERVA
jgi:predicted DNA-binding transcriptional regulator AlpA